METKLASQEFTLLDLGRGLIAKLTKEGIKIPNESQAWHNFFYALKKDKADNTPNFLTELHFDWGGEGHYDPQSPELSEFFHGIYVVHLARAYHGIVLDKKTTDYWMRQTENLPPEFRQYLDHVVKEAKKHLIN